MKYLFTIIAIIGVHFCYAQNLNWAALNEDQNNIAYLNFGYDYSVSTQLGYGYKLNLKQPVFITADFSVPMGENLLDDFKIRVGGQMPIFNKNNFIVSAKLHSIFRRHETKYVRMASFGSSISGVIGYYKSSWHLAAEYGFDKSINTHLKHSKTLKENTSSVTDGWYFPSGGNFFYGIQAGKTLGHKFEMSLQLGVTNAQGKDPSALLPYYFQLGIVYKLGQNVRDSSDMK